MQDGKNRSSLLVRCTEEEAQAIREGAKRERRTVSGFILNILLTRIDNPERERERERETKPDGAP